MSKDRNFVESKCRAWTLNITNVLVVNELSVYLFSSTNIFSCFFFLFHKILMKRDGPPGRLNKFENARAQRFCYKVHALVNRDRTKFPFLPMEMNIRVSKDMTDKNRYHFIHGNALAEEGKTQRKTRIEALA